MDMMQVRRMGMIMANRFVCMQMTMHASRHRGVDVVMVAVIVTMDVLMFQGIVLVFMLMLLGNMQQHAGDHERRAP
jgi:hypothetical protein